MKMVMTGNYATAYGAKLARVEVVAAYPITPQTTVVEKIAELQANKEMDIEYIKVESEHSAMAAVIAASQTGVRAFTATSSHGLLLMHEMLHWAAGARVPVGLVNINRANGPPWSIWADHGDSIAQRDTGMIQYYVESSQEILDTVIQGFKVSEDHEVFLPFMINADAFYLSHTFEIVDLPDQELVDRYLPKLEMEYKLDPDKPYGFGSLSMPHHWYMELRYNMHLAMEKAKEKIVESDKLYGEMIGRSYGGLVERYKTDDAEVVLVAMGTVCSTTKHVVDQMREEGYKVGLLKLRVFRPFPVEEIRDALRGKEAVGVIDRSFTFGYGGALHSELKAALYNMDERLLIKDYIIGIGGRDITPGHIRRLFENLYLIKEKGLDKEYQWIDVKRPEGEVD